MNNFKRFLLFCGTFVALSFFAFTSTKYISTLAEEENGITETIVEEETEEITEEEQTNEEVSLSQEISQTCKDCIEYTKQLLSQPLVIGGVSTTVGALAVMIISKAIGGAKSKKVKELLEQINELKDQAKENITKKDYNALASQSDTLKSVLNELVSTCKNTKVKEQCQNLLKELEPIKEEATTFVKEETEKVATDTKAKAEEIAPKIIDILNN